MATEQQQVSFGETVYDEEGNELGRVRGLDEHGFYVTTAAGVVAMSVEHEADTKAGIKELQWRCWECGEIGAIDEMPETCPNCGAPEEEIYYWQQD
jgi:rubrerythrin